MAKRKKDKLPESLSGTTKDTKAFDLFQMWKTRVLGAQEIRKKWEDEYKVKQGEEFFLGKQRAAGDEGIVINRFWSTIKVIKPNLFYSQPKFFVRPKTGRIAPVEERRAAIGEGALESVGSQDQNLMRSGSLAVLQAFFRIGSLKDVYDPRLVPNPMAGEPMFVTDASGEIRVDKETGDQIPLLDPITNEQMVEKDEVMSDEAYRYEWVDAVNMLLPDEGPDQAKWTWIGEEVTVPLDEAKEDKRFKANLRSKLEANVSRDTREGEQIEHKHQKDEELFKYYELYDIKGKKWYILADGQSFNEFLVQDDLQDGIEDHPYSLLLGWTPILAPEPSPWPMPHVYPWIELQREWNIRRQQVIEGGKRAARKGIYDDSSFPNEEEAKRILQSPNDMEWARVNDLDSHAPRILETPPISADIWADLPLIERDWQQMTGRSSP
ncbi:hypothetical protein LCGC14_2299310, partial [marine sediment metagenome]